MNSTEKTKILVVDDTPENIDVLIETLKGEYRLVAALNGEKALQLAGGESPPELILLDIMMPGIDGFEVCTRLKSNDKTKNIPVIFITAKTEVEDEKYGFEVGAIDYITKPLSPSIVRARVRTHLSLQKARKELERQNEILLENSRLKEDVERITKHDMKSPLSGIISFPGFIKAEGGLNEEQAELLDLIEEAGYRLLSMINLSLDLYKMETGAYDFAPKKVNLIPLIRKIFKELDGLKNSYEVEFAFAVKGQDADQISEFVIQGDELLCYSMLANLIKNAVEACKPGDSVAVNLVVGQEAEIIIHNPSEVPAEIKETFFEKDATSGKEKGTGLGTYSARLIAETQKGNISMDSSKEKGTTVTVRLHS